VSRRRFLGWEPRRVTTYEYENGLVVRAVTETEPEWDEEQRGWAYALADIEADLCPGGCGQPLVESTAVGADDDYDVRFIQCHACAARARRTEDRDSQGELLVVVRSAARTPLGG
jgi:hypothetical protein